MLWIRNDVARLVMPWREISPKIAKSPLLSATKKCRGCLAGFQVYTVGQKHRAPHVSRHSTTARRIFSCRVTYSDRYTKRFIGPADVPGAWGFLFSILRIPICLQARVPYILGKYGYSTPKSPHCQHYFFSGSYPGIMGPGQCFGRFGFLSRF